MLPTISYLFFLSIWLFPSTNADGNGGAPALSPSVPIDDTLVVAPPAAGVAGGIGAWPVSGGALFARQGGVCTDPAYLRQCAAVIGSCCQTQTYCCPNNMAFCCNQGDTCQVIYGQESCCPPDRETCDGRQCAQKGSVCCNTYGHVCRPGEDCCGNGCCDAGTKCCGGICCDAGNECCPGANGGQGGCCWPGNICCGDECCDPAAQTCSNGRCVMKPTLTRTTTSTAMARGETAGVTATRTVLTGTVQTGAGAMAEMRWVGVGAVPLGVALGVGLGGV